MWNACFCPAGEGVAFGGVQDEVGGVSFCKCACSLNGGGTCWSDRGEQVDVQAAEKGVWSVFHWLDIAYVVLGNREERVLYVGLLLYDGGVAREVTSCKAVGTAVGGVVEAVGGDACSVVRSGEYNPYAITRSLRGRVSGGFFEDSAITCWSHRVDSIDPEVGLNRLVDVEDDGGLCSNGVACVAEDGLGLDGERHVALARVCRVVDGEESSVDLYGGDTCCGVDAGKNPERLVGSDVDTRHHINIEIHLIYKVEACLVLQRIPFHGEDTVAEPEGANAEVGRIHQWV